MNTEVHEGVWNEIGTGTSKKVWLLILIVAGVAMSLLFMLVDHGSLFWLGMAFLILSIGLIWYLYLSWYCINFYQDHLVLKHFGRVHEIDYRYITDVGKSFWGQKINVQMGASTQKYEFYVWPSEYLALDRAFRFRLPLTVTDYKFTLPYRFEFKYAKLHPFILVVWVAVIVFSVYCLVYEPDFKEPKMIALAIGLISFGCWGIYSFFFQLRVALLFEEDQLAIITRARRITVPGKEVHWPGLGVRREYSAHGANQYVDLEIKMGKHTVNINTNDTDIPLSEIKSLLIRTYWKTKNIAHISDAESENNDGGSDEEE